MKKGIPLEQIYPDIVKDLLLELTKCMIYKGIKI
jgi:hypothetical protein